VTTRIINVASASPALPLATLATLARSEDRVMIFSTMAGRVVGHCRRYWLDGDNLWAEADLEDAHDPGPGVHAESIVALKEGRTLLCAVVLTRLHRGMMQHALVGTPFLDAMRATLDANGFIRKPS
jgi:hypothetical protein